jgi:hypothetical protein
MNMRRLIAGIALPGAVIGALAVAGAPPAFAAGPASGLRSLPASAAATGNDLSYPQCGTAFPTSPAFGIVGINGGLANDLNPCLGPSTQYPTYQRSELYWALASSSGSTSQPKASLYLNTADPGNTYNGTPIADWPTSSSASDPYGSCTTTAGGLGQNSTACAWQYGYDKAAQDAAWLASAANAINAQAPPVSVSNAASSYPWWLDVETVNTWQSGTSGQAMNTADLQGMIDALRQAGASVVGAYSTSSQWNSITGGTTSGSGSLYGIPDWIPGARTLSGAKSDCGLASFTKGKVTVTQWTSRPDGDYAC